MHFEVSPHTQKILVVDDEEPVRKAVARTLSSATLTVETAESAETALAMLQDGSEFVAIISDLEMPGMGGLEFLRRIRERNLDVPVIILTGNATLESAIAAVQYGGFRYMQKPFGPDELIEAVRSASAMHQLAILKRRALEICDSGAWTIGDAAGLDAHFDQAMSGLWMAFQPIVDWPKRTIYGYEGLVRSEGPELKNPGLLFEAAERLGRVKDLGRAVRRAVAAAIPGAPKEANIFVNLHSLDLGDDDLYASSSPLSHYAKRVVLEITERMSLHRIGDLRERMQTLRKLGYRIAVDDLGAGYAGLSSFSQLEPDVAKLDMSLIRGIDTSSRKASIVGSMISVCMRDLDTRVVCEGVETPEERDALQKLGADLLQGYHFARPDSLFRTDSIFPV